MRELTELYYFSPTGGTKKAGMLLCEGISWDVEAVDLGKEGRAKAAKGDLVVAAMLVLVAGFREWQRLWRSILWCRRLAPEGRMRKTEGDPGVWKKVREKLEKGSHGAVEIPGNRPYKDEMEIPATPMSAPSCTKCGRCAWPVRRMRSGLKTGR